MPDRMPMFGRLVVWECERCTTKRDDILQPNDGRLLARVYRYADGYLAKRPTGDKRRGGRLFTASALRVALLHRDNEADAEAS